MKKVLQKLIIFLIPALLFASCTKDKYSEKDALDSQQKVDLLISVVDLSSMATPVNGATVTAIVDSSVVTKTTNSNGIALFKNVKIGGNTVVTVVKENYTSILSTVDITPASYRQTQISETVGVYSKDTTRMVTFKGRLTYEGDLTNRTKEPAAGVVVRVQNQSLIETNQFFTATTDANGRYEVMVPISTQGNSIRIYYPEFVAKQKLAIIQDNNIPAVVERPVLFKSDASPSFSIPVVPSAYATIAAPTLSAGAGLQLGAKPNRVSLSSYTNYLLIDGGAGYNGGASIANYQFSFSPDKNGVSSKLQVDIVNGKITNIDGIIDNGATYDAPPTLSLNDLSPSTPANIGIYYRTTYKVYIANKGSNYVEFPTVSTEAYNYSGFTKYQSDDNDINDASNVILGVPYILSNFANIRVGRIVAAAGNADTLITTGLLASQPVFSVIEPSVINAAISIPYYYISTSDSTISDIKIDNIGLGYDPVNPPAITITTLAGYGSGAVAKANVNSSTQVAYALVTNPGHKYIQNVNDCDKSGHVSYFYLDPTYPNTSFGGVNAGDVKIQDVYYGTGYQIISK